MGLGETSRSVSVFEFPSCWAGGCEIKKGLLGWHYPGKDWKVPVGAIDTTKAKRAQEKGSWRNQLKVSHLFRTRNRLCPSSYDDYKLSFAFVMAAILAIAGGVIAILPAAMDFMGKKK